MPGSFFLVFDVIIFILVTRGWSPPSLYVPKRIWSLYVFFQVKRERFQSGLVLLWVKCVSPHQMYRAEGFFLSGSVLKALIINSWETGQYMLTPMLMRTPGTGGGRLQTREAFSTAQWFNITKNTTDNTRDQSREVLVELNITQHYMYRQQTMWLQTYGHPSKRFFFFNDSWLLIHLVDGLPPAVFSPVPDRYGACAASKDEKDVKETSSSIISCGSKDVLDLFLNHAVSG